MKGKRFLFPGIGYGGSCFPKDVQALVKSSNEVNYNFEILKAVEKVNAIQKLHLVKKINAYFKNELKGKKIALWGLAFKPNTDDIRDAPAIDMIDAFVAAGAIITAYDPEAMVNVKNKIGDKIKYAANQYEALGGADILVIATEWSEFRTPDFEIIEIIACSAWTSTSRDLSEDKKKRIPKLIDMLWSNGHETPFEKGMVHFLVDTDIASHIHLLKHRISSMNAESARYKELKEDKYYLPEDWKDLEFEHECKLTESGKSKVNWYNILEDYTKQGNYLYHKCLADLEPILGRKRAKESARFFKTYNSQIQGDVSFNMRSFANFLKLRRDSHAQLEIYQIADQMLELVKGIEGNPFKHTLKAWGY